MQVNTREIEYCKYEIEYHSDQDVVSSKRDEIVADLRKVSIPGYRPGKAPDSAIRARLKKHIDKQLTLHMKGQAYDDVIFETEFKPIGYPQFTEMHLDGNKFSCRMTMLKKPDFELGNYKFEIPRPQTNIDIDAEVQKNIEAVRVRLSSIRPYEDNEFVDNGDQITMDFEATIDGQPFDGSVVEGQLYVVGQNSFKDFDDQLLGMGAGEEREFDIMFPESFPNIGGKTAHFKVRVHMGTKRVLPSVDDEFAKKCGSDNLTELMNKLQVIANAKMKQAELVKIRSQIALRLVDSTEIKVPEFLTNIEAQHLCAQNGIIWSDLSDDEKKVFQDQATKNVSLSLILDTLREKEPDAILSDAEAQQGLVRKLQAQGQDVQKFFTETQKNGSLLGLITSLKDEFTLQWVADQATLID